MWHARAFVIAENVAIALLRIYIINCPSRISFILQQNGIDCAASKFMLVNLPFCGTRQICWSIWPFELSEL